MSAREAQQPRGTYLFPRHPSERDRLDIQHYALREVLEGNYLAPVETPAAVLDVGAGTGQWAFEVGATFSDAMVVGIDLVPSKSDPPANYRFVKGNVLQGLPFADGRFDLVHQRFLTTGIPLRSWSGLLEELIRVTRPGGWVELVEGAAWIAQAGPATAELTEFAHRLGRARGLDTTGVVIGALDEQLQRAGAVEVKKRALDLPVGEWGGRVGSFMASDIRAAYARLGDVFQQVLDVPREDSLRLLGTAQQEWEQFRSSLHVVLAFGRRPG
jgi:SAM-dependent methyltransferase